MERHAVITGGAGFIGSHVVDGLLGEGGWKVTVIDNFDPFYPRAVKEANLAKHRTDPAFTLVEGDILDDAALAEAFRGAGPQTVVLHLAALVGVRPSMARPQAYHRVNVEGTLRVLEKARAARVPHVVLASSSSIYGKHPAVPWSESLGHLEPISLYAATKLAAEEFARAHARLHGMAATALRFFTVYGPRQRPDLAIHAFFRDILGGRPIKQFGDGSTSRDYTYIADIVAGIRRAMDRPVVPGGFEAFNLGNSAAVPLRGLIAAIEAETGRKARVEVWPDQAGDVPRTCADIRKAQALLGYAPATALREGLLHFHRWYAGAVAAGAPEPQPLGPVGR